MRGLRYNQVNFVPPSSMLNVGWRLARNLQGLEAPSPSWSNDHKAPALPRFLTTDNSMGPEEK
jgi:hypothetical protein